MIDRKFRFGNQVDQNVPDCISSTTDVFCCQNLNNSMLVVRCWNKTKIALLQIFDESISCFIFFIGDLRSYIIRNAATISEYGSTVT